MRNHLKIIQFFKGVYGPQGNYNGKTPRKALKSCYIQNNQYINSDSSGTYSITSYIKNKLIANNNWIRYDSAVVHGYTVPDTFHTTTPIAATNSGVNLYTTFADDYYGKPRPIAGDWYIGP